MKTIKERLRAKAVGVLCTVGVVCQFGGCSIGEITVTQTVDGRELLISLIRGAILGPIDEYITTAVNEAFDDDE